MERWRRGCLLNQCRGYFARRRPQSTTVPPEIRAMAAIPVDASISGVGFPANAYPAAPTNSNIKPVIFFSIPSSFREDRSKVTVLVYHKSGKKIAIISWYLWLYSGIVGFIKPEFPFWLNNRKYAAGQCLL